jgi:hypothetical protein
MWEAAPLLAEIAANNSQEGLLITGSDEALAAAAEILTEAGFTDSAQEVFQDLRDLRAVGLATEIAYAKLIVEDGYELLGGHVYVQTSLGLRITDILTEQPGGGMMGFEIKAGPYAGSFNSLQQQKDSYIATYGGTIVSYLPLGGGLTYGSHVTYPTTWVYIYKLD